MCHAPVAPGDRFCERCGAALPTTAAATESEPFELPSFPQPERTRRLRSRRRPRWYNRWPARIAALVLLLVAGSGAYVWMRVDRTMTEINSLSTLPPYIQDHTVSEIDGTPIVDLASISLPPTRVGPPPTVVVPEYEGASPGGPVRQTAVALLRNGSPAAVSAAASGVVASPVVGSPVAATPIPNGDAQAESMLAAGMTFDTGPAQTAVAEAAAQRTRTPTPSGS